MAKTPVDSRTYLASYISGYVDGEGCFTVSFSRRISMRGGWEVRPSFSVSQNGNRAEVLHVMMEYFSCGSLRPDRSDSTIKFEVRRIEDLVSKVIPHFDANPLLSSKKADYQAFSAACALVSARAHLTEPGLRRIVDLALGMNSSGKRKFTAADMLGSVESKVIVSASSNGGQS